MLFLPSGGGINFSENGGCKITDYNKIGILVMAALCLGSCQKEFTGRITAGEEVRFTAGSGSAETKASYSGDGTSTVERIDWGTNDLIRIYCAQADEPSDKWADYAVTSIDAPSSGSAISTARIEGTGGVGLRWGTGDHTFYAAFPAPGPGCITTGISANTVSANLSATQAIDGDIEESSGNFVASPDLKNMLMTAKAGPYNEAEGIPEGSSVFLSFTPLTTAIKFTITNDTGSQLDLTSVQLISGNKKASAPVIAGAFTVDLDETGIPSGTEVKPFESEGNDFTITYGRSYPKCTAAAATSTDQEADRTLTIAVGTESAPLSLAVGKTLTFTFFLNPCHDFNDLTFKLVKAGGSWMSTRLGYTDGNGIFFPRHKKSTVTGLLVPEGAQWRVSFGPDVTPWDAEHGELDNIDLNYPEGETITLMTAWEEGESATIDMVRSVVTFVDLGLPSGTLWADRNVGAASETDAAYVAYGNNAHISTSSDYQELMDNCTITWTNDFEGTGVKGFICASSIAGYTDQYIFLPAAGRRKDSGISGENENLRYWTSTLATEATAHSSGDMSAA